MGITPGYLDLVGRIAVVAGGSRGIGAATCRLLAQSGARVACVARGTAGAETLAEGIRDKGGIALAVAADCTRWDEVEHMRRQVETELGSADLLAAFVGGGGEPAPVETMSEDAWRSALDTNLTSAFLTLRSFLPGMIARRRGAVVLLASAAGRQPGGASAAYAAAKAGVVMLTRHVAREVARHGVRVNCLAPSTVLSKALRSQLPLESRRQMMAAFPLGRIGEPEDVARAAAFLLSEASSWITGVTIDVAGGRVMG